MQVIVKYYGNLLKDVHNILGYTPIVYSFRDKFNSYVKSLKKNKKYLATEEAFSLDYDSTLADLKKSVWISISEKELPTIKEHLDILEICK